MAKSTDAESVAVFGGSFNPPHIGHVLAVSYAQAVGGFDRILVVPVYSHAFDKDLEPFEDRVRMTERAFSQCARAEVSAIEGELGAPSRTLRTLEALGVRHPEWRMRLIVGADVLRETHKWHAFDIIEQLAPPFVLGRRGTDVEEAPKAILPEISSTEVRQLLAQRGYEASLATLTNLVPRAVLEYIHEAGLYGGRRSRSREG